MFWWCSVVLHDIYKISKVLILIDFQETFVKLERDTPDTKGGPAAVSDIKGWRPFCTDVPWSKGARIEAWMTIHTDFHSISLDIVADVCFKDLDTHTHSLSLSDLVTFWRPMHGGPVKVAFSILWSWWAQHQRQCQRLGPVTSARWFQLDTLDTFCSWKLLHVDHFSFDGFPWTLHILHGLGNFPWTGSPMLEAVPWSHRARANAGAVGSGEASVPLELHEREGPTWTIRCVQVVWLWLLR